jgi:hypothetical protein
MTDRQRERALPVRSQQPARGTHAHTLCSHWHTLSQHQGPGYHATPRWSRRTDGWMRLLIDIENNNFAKTGSGQVKKKGAFVYINGLTMGHCASQSPLRRGIPSPFRGHQPAENTLFWGSFPYVRPEPALVKRSFLAFKRLKGRGSFRTVPAPSFASALTESAGQALYAPVQPCCSHHHAANEIQITPSREAT